MAQEWNMRRLLIDKQGNFGSIAGLPPAAMRYTEARLSGRRFGNARRFETRYRRLCPHVRRSAERTNRSAQQISQPVGERIRRHRGRHGHQHPAAQSHRDLRCVDSSLIDEPDTTIDELCAKSSPDRTFPTGGIICGRAGIRRGYKTGRSTIVLSRAKCRIEEMKGSEPTSRIIVTEIPYQQYARSRWSRRSLRSGQRRSRSKGFSGIRDESDLKEPVRLVIELKRNEDPDVILNQLYQFSPLQDDVFADLSGAGRRQTARTDTERNADGVPSSPGDRDSSPNTVLARTKRGDENTPWKVCCWRWPTSTKSFKRFATSRTQAEAKDAFDGHPVPRIAMMQRALGDEGFPAVRDWNAVWRIAYLHVDQRPNRRNPARCVWASWSDLEQEKLNRRACKKLLDRNRRLRRHPR